MKQIIDGKMYNTDTADEIASWDNGCYGNDFNACEEALYQTKKGVFFVYGTGGPRSKYAQSFGSNSFGGGGGFNVLSSDEAFEWLQDHGCTKALETYFADLIEEA